VACGTVGFAPGWASPQAVDEVMQEVSLAAVRQQAPLNDPEKVARGYIGWRYGRRCSIAASRDGSGR